MAATFTLITECPASAAEMFDVSLDIDAHVDSMSSSQELAIDGVTTGRIGLGQTVTWLARYFGIWFEMTSTITTLDRPHHFIDEQVSGPFKSYSHEHFFEDIPSGCRMIDTVTVANPVFGFIADRLVLVPYLRRLMIKRNRALIRLVG